MPKGEKDTQSLNEKSALEKATGLSSQPESITDSKQNIQQPDKEISVAELIRLSMKNAEEIKAVRSDLYLRYNQKDAYQKRLDEITGLLKPVSRSSKKIHTTQPSQSPLPRERKVLRAERDDLDHQLFLVSEEIAAGEEKLSRLTGKSCNYSKEKKLRSKANGPNYVKNNKHVFRSKLLKALNKFYQTADPETISKIRTFARSTAHDAPKTFKWEFGNILEAIDSETFILCSGLLGDELYEAARLTILSKNAAFKGTFEELIMPE